MKSYYEEISHYLFLRRNWIGNRPSHDGKSFDAFKMHLSQWHGNRPSLSAALRTANFSNWEKKAFKESWK